jgi:hypothetical protein
MLSAKSKNIYTAFEMYVSGFSIGAYIEDYTHEEITEALYELRHDSNKTIIKSISERLQDPNKIIYEVMEERIKQIKETQREKIQYRKNWILVIGAFVLNVVLSITLYYLKQ